LPSFNRFRNELFARAAVRGAGTYACVLAMPIQAVDADCDLVVRFFALPVRADRDLAFVIGSTRPVPTGAGPWGSRLGRRDQIALMIAVTVQAFTLIVISLYGLGFAAGAWQMTILPSVTGTRVEGQPPTGAGPSHSDAAGDGRVGAVIVTNSYGFDASRSRGTGSPVARGAGRKHGQPNYRSRCQKSAVVLSRWFIVRSFEWWSNGRSGE